MFTVSDGSQQFIIHLASQVGFVLVATIVIALSAYFFLRSLSNGKKTPQWMRIAGKTGCRPVPWLILIYGLIVCAKIILIAENLETTATFVATMLSVGTILALLWLFFRWKRDFETSLFKTSNQKALVLAIGKISSILFVLIGLLMVLRVLNIPIEALLTLGGIGTLTIGWAGKDVVANLFGGLMIYLNRPFSVSDYIYSPNKNFRGVVENIGWYMTLIRDPDYLPTYIPNAIITDAVVHNYTHMKHRRIRTVIGVSYDDFSKIEGLIVAIEKMFKEHPDIEKSYQPNIHFIKYGDYSLDIEIIALTVTNDYRIFMDVQQDVLIQVGKMIESMGAEMAFPTNTVYLKKEGV